MGSVWLAERLEWGSHVAVKLMDRVSEARPDVLQRFQQEARLAANLRSSHVVQVLDDGRDASTGTPFIVMELLVGETLAQRLARVGRLSPAETSRIVTHVARALALAHELGMVHRDLKPDNIFLVRNDDEESAKVLDFGIAKWQSESFLVDAPTTTGTAIGTPSYMSPEQIQDSKRVDYRADLWSLAVIASECLTGRHTFEADNLLKLALQICNEPPRLPSSLGLVPPGLDAWFERATARPPEQRFGSARELAEELRRVCGVVSSPTETSAPFHLAPSPLSFHPTEALNPSPDPPSTEGLTRTQGAVAAFRGGHRRARLALLGATLVALAGVGLAVRSELQPRTPAARAAAPGSPRTAQLDLRPRAPEIYDPRGVGAALPPVAAASDAVATLEPSARASSEPAVRALASDAPAPHVAASSQVEPSETRRRASPSTGGSRSVAPAADAAAPAEHGAASASPSGERADDAASAEARASREGLAPAAAPASGAPAADLAAAPPESGGSAPAVASESGANAGTSAAGSAVPGDPAAIGSQPPASTALRRFDRDAARRALEEAARHAANCRPPGGPRGKGRVQLRFEPDGKVGAAWLMTPLFDNSTSGSCVLMLFRRATVPEFDGPAEMVVKSFEIP